jgi:citrate synthase
MATPSPWISRADAVARLGVRPQTLYAYVSRGLIRAAADGRDPRRRRYSRHDVEALAARRRHPRRHRDIAAGAIAWGEPVLETSISTVRHERLVFRGRDAVALSRRASLEDAASLLWRASPPARAAGSPRPSRKRTAKARAFDFLGARAAADPPSYGRSQALLHREAAEILSGFADALLGTAASGLIHERIAAAWAVDGQAADVIRRALMLASDHELNASTFAVRVAASAGAPLAAAALAGFGTFAGPLHGGAVMRALELLDRMVASDDPRALLSEALQRGERIFAFGHRLYPAGDVRARELLRVLKPPPRIRAAIRAGEQATGERAIFDMALAAMVRAQGLPDDAGFVAFAVGRMAGWLAHALEQRQSGRLIRPRARYTGQ